MFKSQSAKRALMCSYLFDKYTLSCGQPILINSLRESMCRLKFGLHLQITSLEQQCPSVRVRPYR